MAKATVRPGRPRSSRVSAESPGKRRGLSYGRSGMIRTRLNSASTIAALVALLMMSFASFQSLLMQTSMPSPQGAAEICGGRLNAAQAKAFAQANAEIDRASAAISSRDGHPKAPDPQKEHCPYCAVASQTTLVSAAPRVCPTTICEFASFAAFIGPRLQSSAAVPPRARDPPQRPLFI